MNMSTSKESDGASSGPTTKTVSDGRRKMLRISAGALCSEIGFGTIENSALETLTEAMQSYIVELARSSKAYAELACRTKPMYGDVLMAQIDMGCNVRSLLSYARRTNKTVLLPPAHKVDHPPHKSLQTGDKRPHPGYVPEYLPPLPDPHSYITTDTQRQPVNEYQIIREKAASQKRDVERALTRFIAKTGTTHNLFRSETTSYPLIACSPSTMPYLSALLPKDFELDSYDSEKKEKDKKAMGTGGDSNNEAEVDNPYLRPIRLPRSRVKKKYY
ncbi:transcription initiation factor TFIID subunit 8-like [Lineus longissimus]|uniref:transcription initiation factor TFIID subunit 8-like n=1 Tax=Lineus longissimus TaxID=88925 RepID=UPI00315CBB90